MPRLSRNRERIPCVIALGMQNNFTLIWSHGLAFIRTRSSLHRMRSEASQTNESVGNGKLVWRPDEVRSQIA